MQNFARLAGVQDASQQMSSRTNVHDEQPVVSQSDADLESQVPHTATARPSRASLPLDRRPSRKSLITEQSSHPSLAQSAAAQEQYPAVPPIPQRYTASRQSQDTAQVGAEEQEDEIEWGPQHPCFPHANPHVPLNSQEYEWTRIIRVQRDWLIAGDLYPALQNIYPEILVDYISEEEFRSLIETLNKMLKEAFDPTATRSIVDSVMGVLTGFIWDDAGLTGAKSGVKNIERWSGRWNQVKADQGIPARLISLRRTAFMSLDIEIPDPGIDVPVTDDGPGHDGHY